MPEEKKEVVPATSAGEKDERGVSWENRAKEYERKYQELTEKMEEMEVKLNKPPEPKKSDEETQKLILDFVKNPEEFIQTRVASTLEKVEGPRQISEAQNWLVAQGFKSEDEESVVSIIKEYQLEGTPMSKAKTAWKIYQAGKLEKELAGTKREKAVSGKQTEGKGKSIPEKTGETRADLLKQLVAAQKSGQYTSEVLGIIDKLEDVRE